MTRKNKFHRFIQRTWKKIKKAGSSLESAFLFVCKLFVEKSIPFFVQIVTLPWVIFKGLFFTVNVSENGEMDRLHFSATRALFVVGSGMIVYRLFVGGMEIDLLEAGPQIRYANRAIKIGKKPKRNKTILGKGKNSKMRRRRRVRNKNIKTELYDSTKTRAWISIKGVKFYPLQAWEIGAFLIIVLLYFFRRDLRRGSKDSAFDVLLDRLGTAGASRLSGGHVMTSSTNDISALADVPTPDDGPPDSSFVKKESPSNARRRRRSVDILE